MIALVMLSSLKPPSALIDKFMISEYSSGLLDLKVFDHNNCLDHNFAWVRLACAQFEICTHANKRTASAALADSRATGTQIERTLT